MRNKPNRGIESYKRIVDVRNGLPCEKLKRHYRDCAHEVIGWLELMAAKDVERFVFATPRKIASCTKNRKKDYQPYSHRAVTYAISLLQKDRVLSAQVRRFRCGAWRWGYLVAHHSTVCAHENGNCDFKGQRHWEREIKTEKQPDGSWKVSAIGPVLWTDWATRNVLETAGGVRPSVRQENAKCAPKCALDELAKSSQPPEEMATSTRGAAASLVSLGQSALESMNLTTPSETGGQVMVAEKGNSKPNSKTGRADGNEENPRLIDETIGQHFGTQPVWVDIETISAGQMNLVVWEKLEGQTQRDLLDCCNAVIEEFAAEPYRGRETNAMLMDMAAHRFNRKHGEYPKCWLRVLNDLKRSSNTSL